MPCFDYVQALAASDQDVVEIIADVFMAQWPVDVRKMTDALATGDLSPLMHTAHALKGSLGMFGAKPAVVAAAALEKLASVKSTNATPQEIADMECRLKDLQQEVTQLLAALQGQQL